MNKQFTVVLVSLLLISVILSGCLSEDRYSEDSLDENQDELLPYQEDGIYTCINHDNISRCWQTHIPDNLPINSSVPLIIDLHGFGSDSTEHRKLSDFNTIADEYGAIVVYPDGVTNQNSWDTEANQGWNAGWCCADPAINDVDDVGFIEQMVEIAILKHNIDSTRIYLSGWSNGCAMAQRMAMDSSHIFAAVGCMSFYLVSDENANYSPIPIMEVHGFLDQIVLYESSILSVPFNQGSWTDPEAIETGAIENMYEWGEYNGCSGDLNTFELNALYSIQGFDNCTNGTEVRLMTIYAAQHNPYAKNLDRGPISSIFQGTQGLVQSSFIVWDFISQYSKNISCDYC
ncbi:MAG: hypothetical protein NLN64_05755 [Candidatus Thalassarchaeaceae archaeon]|nr:hypothetical protein [Candidatus Thalassarchaeaceae archaeon]